VSRRYIETVRKFESGYAGDSRMLIVATVVGLGIAVVMRVAVAGLVARDIDS